MRENDEEKISSTSLLPGVLIAIFGLLVMLLANYLLIEEKEIYCSRHPGAEECFVPPNKQPE